MAAWERNVFVSFAQMAPSGRLFVDVLNGLLALSPLEFLQKRQKHSSPPVRAFDVLLSTIFNKNGLGLAPRSTLPGAKGGHE